MHTLDLVDITDNIILDYIRLIDSKTNKFHKPNKYDSASSTTEDKKRKRELKENENGVFKTLIENHENFFKEIKALKKDNKTLTGQVATLEEKIETLENAERKNNIVIKGANIQGDLVKEVTEEFVEIELGISVSIILPKAIKSKEAHPIRRMGKV
ncbi:hypothetical protein FQA39_LY13562 [Lamprigera yunnana]|nr:hypothetical protein FQA39_LY13562 [Lamprigera yunnana]